MTHEFDAEAYILEHFDEIQEEAMEKIKTLKYYSGTGWGGGDNSESPSYLMENEGYKHYWVKGWNDDPDWVSHAIMFNGGWDTTGTIDLKKVGWEQPDMKITKILERSNEENWVVHSPCGIRPPQGRGYNPTPQGREGGGGVEQRVAPGITLTHRKTASLLLKMKFIKLKRVK